ncbi:hypothetical protein P7C71_g5996, partial [Lecanoromycetidae sp. Uapishka_2]
MSESRSLIRQSDQEVAAPNEHTPLSAWLIGSNEAPWVGGVGMLDFQDSSSQARSDINSDGREADFARMDEGLFEIEGDNKERLETLEGNTAVESVESLAGRNRSDMLESATISTKVDTENIWPARYDGWHVPEESPEQDIITASDVFLSQGFADLNSSSATGVSLPPSIKEQALIIANQGPSTFAGEEYQGFLQQSAEEQDRQTELFFKCLANHGPWFGVTKRISQESLKGDLNCGAEA